MKVTDRAAVGNAFEFVTMSGARARQLLQGCTPRTQGSPKAARLAQQEVREGKIEKILDETSAD